MNREYSDYTYMWWKDGFNKGDREMLFQTGSYGLSVQTVTGGINRLGLINNPPAAQEVLEADNSAVLSLPQCSSEFSICINGQYVPAQELEFIDQDAQAVSRILESGVSVQRMDVMYYRFNHSPLKGRLELAAFPRFLAVSLWLYVPDEESMRQTGEKINTRFTLDLGECSLLSQSEGITVLRANNEEYYFITSASLSINEGKIIFEAPISLKPGTFNGFSFLYAPSLKAARALKAQKSAQISAVDQHTGRILNTVYDERGYFCVDVSQLTPEGQEQFNDQEARKRYEQVKLTLENNSDFDMLLPVCFIKEKVNFPISGLCPFIRDEEGFPTGIAVQLSKNWHKLRNDPAAGYFYAPDNHPKRFWEGPWLHAYALFNLKAHSKANYLYNCTFAGWGGAFASSHAQLCLAGWGGNYQQWESSAIGSFGEAFCYDPETAHGRAFIDDIRPLLVYKLNDPEQPRYNWTGCNGGGNFLVYEKEGKRVPLKRVRTYFKKQGPNLCEVVYTAVTADESIKLELTAFLPRTDDCSRALHSFKYTFLKDTDFSRLALYQLGADGYNDNSYRTMAIGNDCGPISFKIGDTAFEGEFEPLLSDKNEYMLTGNEMQRITVPGRGLFIGFFKAQIQKTNACKDGPVANRFINLLDYSAVINGAEYDKPAVNLRITHDFNVACAAAELTVNKEAGSVIKAGSVINGTVEYINFPVKKEYYYGPSKVLRGVPSEEFNTFRLAHRASLAGRYRCRVLTGTLTRSYPITVEADFGQSAHIIIEGGFSYVPLVFTGLESYRSYALEQLTPNGWERVDQSVFGNDYWQCAYDSGRDKYELIFNVEHCGEPASEYQYRLVKLD